MGVPSPLLLTHSVNIAGLGRSAPNRHFFAEMVSQPRFLVYEFYLTILTLNKVFETRPMHQDVPFRHFQISACAVIFLALCNLHRDFGIRESSSSGSSDLDGFFLYSLRML